MPAQVTRRTESSRLFHTWDLRTGVLSWCGNGESVWRGHRLPGSMADWLAAVHPDDAAWVEREYGRLCEEGRPTRLEYRVRRPDGKTIGVTAHAASLSPHTVLGCLVRVTNTTVSFGPPPDRPSAAEETHTPIADPTYERFFDLSDDLLCVADLRGYFVRVNPAFGRVLGHPVGDLLREPLLTYVHPDDHPRTLDALDRLNRGERVAEFRNRYRTAAGDYRCLEWTARPVPAERLVFAVARDVTERLQLREQLRQQTERERAILDHTAALVYVKDFDGRYEFVNSQWERVCNWRREQVVGRVDADLFPPEFADRFVAIDRRVLDTGEPFQGEEVAPTADGTRTYVSVKVPLRDAEGRVVALAGVSTDITDRLRAEDAENQLRTARQLQQRLYPAAAPTLPGFDIAGRGRSASVLCGDYYDYIPRADGRLALAVGDVCGHGLGPALTMVETRASLRLLLRGTGPAADALHVLNRQLSCDADHSLFVTLFLAEIDPADRTLTWVGAGHDGHLCRADGTVAHLDSTGVPLGLTDPIDLAPSPAVTVGPGDVLVLFTDGLVEAMCPAGRQFTTDRLLAAVREAADRPAAEIIDRVFAAVDQHSRGHDPKDDMTMVVLKGL
jgi:PAS domain S-box-containing protein